MSTKSHRAAPPPEACTTPSDEPRPWLTNHSKTLGAFMPLRLKAVLREHQISRQKLAEGVLKHDGAPYSESAISQLANHAIWPRLSSVDSVQAQIRARLVELGVPEDRLADVFEVDEIERDAGADASMRAAHSAQMTGRVPPAGFRRKARARPDMPDLDPETEIPAVEPAMLSPEAKRHFRLFRDPFGDDLTGPEDMFLSPDVRYVREAVWNTAKHGGMVAVIGESGAGKSVIRRDLLDRIRRESVPVRVIQPRTIDKGQLTARHICEAVLQDMLPNSPMPASLERIARKVETVLIESSRTGSAHVLIIEEAHDLSVSALKYLKRFWELEDGFRKLLSIILVGQPELKDKLDERVNWQAREVIRRCEIAELPPLDNHLRAYLEHMLKRDGKVFEDVFDKDAVDAIRARLTRPRGSGVLSMLYPLVVNNLVIRALNRAALDGAPVVSADTVHDL